MVGKLGSKKLSILVILAFAAITSLLVLQLPKLRFDYDFEKFFPSNDPDTDYFMEYREKFESDNDFLLIAIENKPSVFEKSFVNQLDNLTKRLSKITDIQSVTSLANIQEVILLPNGTAATNPFLHVDPQNLSVDKSRILRSEELINTLVSEDGTSTCIFIKHTEFLAKKKGDVLFKNVQKAIRESGFKPEQIHTAGRTVGQGYYIYVMNYEMFLFVSLSAILVVVFLLIAFRSGWGVLIPQIIIVSTVVWLLGFLGLFDKPINIILTTLPSVIFVVGMSDVIHFVSRYLDARRTKVNSVEAIRITIREIGLATFLTSLTTAVGFFSLYFVNVEPIRVYGIVLGIGVMLAFALTFLLLPTLFVLFPGPKYIERESKDHFWKKYLVKNFRRVIRHPKRVLTLSSAALLLSLGGIFLLDANNYLMDDIQEEAPIKQDFNFLDKHYGGIRPFELSVTLKDSTLTLWDEETLMAMDTVENYIENVYGAEVKTSLVQTLKVLNRGAHGGNAAEYKLPTSKRKLISYKRMLRLAQGGKILRAFVDSTEKIARISGGMADLGNLVISAKNDSLTNFLNSLPTSKRIEFRITGTAHLLDKNLGYLSSSLIKGLLMSILVVALIMGLIYRSLSMTIISLIPNIFPLLAIAGLMGYTGIDIKVSTAIIFTIAFGIAVDDTIHFLGKFKFELMKGRTKLYALKRSYLTTGKAMILTTLILCAGFLLLMLSSFMGTFYMGLLLCLTLIIALILDLTLLPVLILLFYKPKK